MPGKKSRDKGARNERRVAKMYSFCLDKEVDRELSQYQKKCGRDLKGCKPFCVQVKSGKKVAIRKALEEAFNAIGDGYAYPVAHINEDYKEPMVVIPERVWMIMVEVTKKILK